MDWKRPHYLHTNVIDHPRYGAVSEKFMATTGGTFSIACKLQIGVC